MQSVSVRIWTRFAVSISYGDNHYTIIGVTYLDEYACATTITSTIRTGFQGVHIILSTLESVVFKGFVIYIFALLKKIFYMRIVC